MVTRVQQKHAGRPKKYKIARVELRRMRRAASPFRCKFSVELKYKILAELNS